MDSSQLAEAMAVLVRLALESAPDGEAVAEAVAEALCSWRRKRIWARGRSQPREEQELERIREAAGLTA
jgi:hypothetical protein